MRHDRAEALRELVQAHGERSVWAPPTDPGRLAAGQIRRLDPAPGAPGASRLVWFISEPHKHDWSDVSYPGRAVMTHGLPLYDTSLFCATNHAKIPTRLTGLPFDLMAVVGLMTTIRLDQPRYGPLLATLHAPALVRAAWMSHEWRESMPTLIADGLEVGEVDIQFADPVWWWNGQEAENLRALAGWA